MKQTFSIQLTCSNFPEACFEDRQHIYLAVQKKKELVFDTDGRSTVIEFTLLIEVKQEKDGSPNFLGPYVHGKKGDRFLYLVWYNKIGRLKETFRRAKIKLAPLTWVTVLSAIKTGQPIVAAINLTDAKGHPVCASLKAANLTWENIS